MRIQYCLLLFLLLLGFTQCKSPAAKEDRLSDDALMDTVPVSYTHLDVYKRQAYGGAQQTLPHDWRISLNVFGQTPWIMLQGKGSSFFDYGLSVNKSFLDKRLTLSAFASNFFKKYMDQSSTTEGSGFIRESNYKYSRQRFGISVSYRIGELKASVKKAARTISNDDVKSGGSGSGGGGE